MDPKSTNLMFSPERYQNTPASEVEVLWPFKHQSEDANGLDPKSAGIDTNICDSIVDNVENIHEEQLSNYHAYLAGGDRNLLAGQCRMWDDAPAFLGTTTRTFQPSTAAESILRLQRHPDTMSIASRAATLGVSRRSSRSLADFEGLGDGSFIKRLALMTKEKTSPRKSTFFRGWIRGKQKNAVPDHGNDAPARESYTSRHNDELISDPKHRHWGDFVPSAANTRKVLRVLIDSKEHIACPDSGSEKNIMLEGFALANGFKITRKARDIKAFELGSGKQVWSIGRVKATVKVLRLATSKKTRKFYIFPTCPVPLILGMPFLSEAHILTKNKHLLEKCLPEYSHISTLSWIGTPRARDKGPCNRIQCTLDGRKAIAMADTGSDLNFMCPNCASREGFHVNTREEAQITVELGDGTVTETIGQVYIYNIGLDWRDPVTTEPEQAEEAAQLEPQEQETSSEDKSNGVEEESYGTIFHVLPGLLCDVILGRDILDETDAFNRCSVSQKVSASKQDAFGLNIMIFKRKKKLDEGTSDPKEKHNDKRHAEMLRRAKREEEIFLLVGGVKKGAEDQGKALCRAWDARHAGCLYCHS